MTNDIDFSRSIRFMPALADQAMDAGLPSVPHGKSLSRRIHDAISPPTVSARPSFGLQAGWWNEGRNGYPHCPSYFKDQLRLIGIAREGRNFIESRSDLDPEGKMAVIKAIDSRGIDTPKLWEAASSCLDLRLKELALHHVFAGTRKDFFTRHASWLAVGSAALATGFWAANWQGVVAVDKWAEANHRSAHARVGLELAPNVGLIFASTFCGALIYGIVTAVCSRLNPGALQEAESEAASETPVRVGFAQRANLKDVAIESATSALLTSAVSVPKFIVDGYLADSCLGQWRHGLAVLGVPLDAMMVMASAYIGMKECHTALRQLEAAHVNDPSIPDAPAEIRRHDTAFVLKQMPIRSAQLGTISTLTILTATTALAKMVTEMAVSSRTADGAEGMDRPMHTAMTAYNLVFVVLLVLDAIGLPIHNRLHDKRHERDLEGALQGLAPAGDDPTPLPAIDRRTSFFGPAGGLRIVSAPPVRWVLGLTDKAASEPLASDEPSPRPGPDAELEAGAPVLPPIPRLSLGFDPAAFGRQAAARAPSA